jgi:hypothetical protein
MLFALALMLSVESSLLHGLIVSRGEGVEFLHGAVEALRGDFKSLRDDVLESAKTEVEGENLREEVDRLSKTVSDFGLEELEGPRFQRKGR